VSFRAPGTLRVLRALAWISGMRLLRAFSVQRARRQARAAPAPPGRRGAASRRSGARSRAR
jgi:hypothetical protein